MKRGYTTSEEYKIVYEWKIDKIDRFLKSKFAVSTDNFILFSPTFSTGTTIIEDEWYIRLKIQYYSSAYIGLYTPVSNMTFALCSLNQKNKINIKFSSYVLNNEKNKVLETKEEYYLLTENETEIFQIALKDLMEKKDEYLADDTLTFCLDLTVYDTPVSTSKKLDLNIPKNQMAHDYTELYKTKMGSDVIINVGSKKFRAHRSILMARSPVLAAMFSHDMIEKKESKISIPDLTPVIFEKLLKYFYTDEVDDLDAYAERLLEAADKYQLLSLKKMCQESLSITLTVENALKIMTLADRHSAEHLLEFTNKFMESNIKKIIETQNFKEFKKSNPPLAFELLEKFAFFK